MSAPMLVIGVPCLCQLGPSSSSEKQGTAGQAVLRATWQGQNTEIWRLEYFFNECHFLQNICAVSADIHTFIKLRALGLLLADGTPTVGGGKTF